MRYFIKRKNNIEINYGLFIVLVLLISSVFPSLAKKENNEVANLTARDVFANIYCPPLEILPKSTRLDMLDYWDVDSVYRASNAMEGLSWLVNVTPSFLKVQITSVSTLEIKILPAKHGELILTVYTIGDDMQAQDSQLNFYDENLTLIPADKHFDMPDLKDYFDIPKGSVTTMKEIREMIPFPTVRYEASPENDNLTSQLTVKEFINQDDWNIIKLFLKPSVILDWHKDKYKIAKSK